MFELMCWIALQAVQVILCMVDVVGIVLMMVTLTHILSVFVAFFFTHPLSRSLALSLALSLVSLSHDFETLL